MVQYFDKFLVAHLVKKFSVFMEFLVPLSYSQNTVNGPCSETV